MPILARGAALVDSSGTLVTADAGFLRGLALPAEAPAPAWSDRAAREAGLAAFLRGEGPAEVPVLGAAGAPLTLERHRAPWGLLLVLRADGDDERLEHAARSQGLGLQAAGLAHDVAGALNTMTLQLALLGEKLAGAPAARHLGALRDQIERVDRLVRRFREVAEPPPAFGGLDLAALATEVVAACGHELQRRSVRVGLEGAPGVARTQAAPERTTRLVLGLITQAVSATPDGGALDVRAAGLEGWATLDLDHAVGAPRLDLGYYSEVAAAAAAALGGRLTRITEDGRERVTLQLPRSHQG